MKRLSILLVLIAGPAFAHAHLVASEPGTDARVKAPAQIKLHFSESLEPAFSGAELLDASGKTVPASRAVGGDSITLMPRPLAPGRYSVNWHSVGRDTHRLTGSFGFTVLP